jgi:hypothetical protein
MLLDDRKTGIDAVKIYVYFYTLSATTGHVVSYDEWYS